MRFLNDPLSLLYFIPIFLITITVHEVAHAYTAYRLGDPTAAAMGRITLNPLKHLDPFGFIMLLIVGFGWAKPVQINPRNFRNEKAGMAISALAGPVSNILMAFAGLIFLNIVVVIVVNTSEWIYDMGDFYYAGELIYDEINDIHYVPKINSILRAALRFFYQFATLNIYFAVFNLLPVPPLDGSRIVNYFLPPRLSYYYSYVERYGFIVLMILIYTRILTIPLIFFAGFFLSAMDFVLSLFFNIFI
ncbi:MAG: site-2 protease family protein [Oscillospiraceae bacterium]|nr:site-2 protease family protein [Oscillospiraceae bacterium]